MRKTFLFLLVLFTGDLTIQAASCPSSYAGLAISCGTLTGNVFAWVKEANGTYTLMNGGSILSSGQTYYRLNLLFDYNSGTGHEVWIGCNNNFANAHFYGTATSQCQNGNSDSAGLTSTCTISGDCNAGPPPVVTNSWCVYTINWVNPGPLFANLSAYFMWPSNLVTEVPAWPLIAVSPGATYSKSYTNDIGTNGTCPSLVLYDSRLGDNAPITTIGGTKYSQTSGAGPGSGSSPGNISPGPIAGVGGNTNTASAGTTNPATQKDIYTASDANSRALAALEKTISDGQSKSLAYSTNMGGRGGTNTTGGASSNTVASAMGSGPAGNVASVGDYNPNATTGLSLGSAPSGLSFAFCGRTLNLDPESISPGIGIWCRMILSIPLYLWFMLEIGKLFSQLSQVYASAETGGVPDLNASLLGTGGNAAGMVTAALVTTAFLVLWAGLWSWFYGAVMTKLGLANGLGGSISSGNAIAVYLLLLFIPVQLYLTLGTTIAMVHFGSAKLVILASSASRYLWGK